MGQLHLFDGDREPGGVEALLHQLGQATVDTRVVGSVGEGELAPGAGGGRGFRWRVGDRRQGRVERR